MRKLAGWAVAVALVAGGGIPSADAAMKGGSDHKNVLTTNAFNFIIATFGAEYERVLSEKSGVYGAFRYGSFKIGDSDASWPGVSVGYHMYPGGHAPTGFYWGPLAYFNAMTVTFSGLDAKLAKTTEKVSATFIGPMVDAGTRWDWGGFVLSPSLQIGYLTGEAKSTLTGASSFGYGGFAWGLGLNVGAAF